MFPSIAEYNQTIQTKGGNALKTLSNLTFIPSRTVPVKIYSYGSGSYAVVFKAKDQYNEFAIRCFISAEQENIDRYRKIDNYLKDLDASWVTKIELLEEEINVGHKHYPVIKMDWVEGQLLNNFVTQVMDNNSALSELQDQIIRVSKSLESLKIGHGDIQCGNVIIAKSTEGKNVIKLIDYDGMYIPPFSNKTNLERGRTEFQHPNRSQIQFNEKIDRFSFWFILCAIEALKYDKTLWFEVMRGGFNTLDNLLFIGDDFKYFNNSKLVNRLYALNKPSLSFYLNKLNKFCNLLPENVEKPTIFNSGTLEIVDTIPQTLQTDDDNRQIEIITNPIGAVVLTSSFQRIGLTPLKIEKSQYLDKTLILSYGTQIKQVTIQQNISVVDIAFNEKLYSPSITNQPNQDHQNVIVSQMQTTTSFVESKTDNSLGIILGVLAFIVIIMVIVSIKKGNEPSYNPSVDNNNTYNTAPSRSYIDTTAATVADSVVTTPLPAVDTTAVAAADTTAVAAVDTAAVATVRDTTATSPIINEDNTTPISYKDDDSITAEQAVKIFLGALGNKDCDAAWNITYNPTWENKGKDWFCSYEAFGGITKVLLDRISTISQGFNEAEIYVSYYTEDIYNGNKCYKQNIIVKKILFDDNQTRWMISKMENLQIPSPCQVND